MTKTLLTLLAFAGVAQGAIHKKWHRITSFDGVELEANSYAPKEITKPLPLVVMINSWALSSTEYQYPSDKIAEREYITVEYAARGWWTSGGQIGTAGPDDIKDHAEVITWALAYWGDKLNTSAIATGGISYGAGISLISGSVDSRVSTIFAFSGWASLVDSLWWNTAPSLFWNYLLIEAGKATGREPEVLKEMLDNMMHYKNINETIAWADVRSPRTYLDQMTAQPKNVLMSHQFEDNLFHSNFQLGYWEKLTGPKRLFLNQGSHGTAESKGMAGVIKYSNQIWSTTYMWLDRFLKGVHNGVETGPLVQIELSDKVIISEEIKYANYTTWPPKEASENYQVLSYRMSSRSNTTEKKYGVLAHTPVDSAVDAIKYTNETEMNCGLDFVTPAEAPKVLKTINIARLNPDYEIAFLTAPLAEKTRFCGNFNITGLLATTNTERFQVNGYLWSVKPASSEHKQEAALMSHGPLDVWAGHKAGDAFALPPLTFHAACRDIAAGDMLMLGFNLHNGRYKGANDSAALTVQLNYNTARLYTPTVAIV